MKRKMFDIGQGFSMFFLLTPLYVVSNSFPKMDLWLRILIFCLSICFSYYIYTVAIEHRQMEKDLKYYKRVNEELRKRYKNPNKDPLIVEDFWNRKSDEQ